MKMVNHPLSVLVGCASALTVLVITPSLLPGSEEGIASAAASADAAADSLSQAPEPIEGLALEVGMTAEQVRKLVGEPREIRPMASGAGKAEVWLYVRNLGQVTRMVATSMREVPFVDPITGIDRPIQEPVLSQEIETLRAELQLLMFQGRLVHWKQKPLPSERQFTG